MKVLEFLNTTSICWKAVILCTDDIDYTENNLDAGESYSDMREIPERYLNATIDVWDVEIIIRGSGIMDYYIVLLISA